MVFDLKTKTVKLVKQLCYIML